MLDLRPSTTGGALWAPRLLAPDPPQVPIDSNGNLASRTEGSDTWVYEWNARNELTRVTKNSIEQARFAYDPFGRRVEKVAGGVTTTYAYDGENILRELRGAATLKYVHGEFIDEPLAVDDGTAVSYLHADMLGSIVRITNTAGAVSLTRQYDAWGNLEEGAGEPGYAYTGREWDPQSGLYYYRARYYDPKIGRFVSEDPVGFRAGPNFYTYVSSNPVNLADPSGLLEVCCRATKYKFLGDKCHCFIVFDDGTTVGAYRVGVSLQKQLNHPDDKPKPPGTKCTKLPLGRCDELKILDLYFRYPDIEPYGPDNTSNTPPSYFLREIGWGGLPKCAQGQVPLQ